MSDQTIFKRYEIKYMLTKEQYTALRKLMENYMVADEHGMSTNCSLYFDTPNYLLIRRSMDKPMYKEKLRVRSYGVADKDSRVFIELKKKYDSVVYKRRIGMSCEDMERYLLDGEKVEDTQITREIDYALQQYEDLKPSIMLSYDRAAFYGKDDHDFRMTFDQNILWRDYDLSLRKGIYGTPILEEGQVLLEVKVAQAFPMWLIQFFNENKLYKTSFSKYTNAYTALFEQSEDLLGIKKAMIKNNYRYIKNAGKEIHGGLVNYA